MIFDLVEHGAGARVGAGRDLRLLRAAHPADGIVIGAAAARALEPRRPLLRFFREELAFVHGEIITPRSAIRDAAFRSGEDEVKPFRAFAMLALVTGIPAAIAQDAPQTAPEKPADPLQYARTVNANPGYTDALKGDEFFGAFGEGPKAPAPDTTTDPSVKR